MFYKHIVTDESICPIFQVGLAVDDIQEVREQSKLQTLAMQVKL
jgi:hypothetical protein